MVETPLALRLLVLCAQLVHTFFVCTVLGVMLAEASAEQRESAIAQFCRHAVSELRPFFLLAILIEQLPDIFFDGYTWYEPALFAMSLWVWFILRNQGDDRWWRRRRRMQRKLRAVFNREG